MAEDDAVSLDEGTEHSVRVPVSKLKKILGVPDDARFEIWAHNVWDSISDDAHIRVRWERVAPFVPIKTFKKILTEGPSVTCVPIYGAPMGVPAQCHATDVSSDQNEILYCLLDSGHQGPHQYAPTKVKWQDVACLLALGTVLEGPEKLQALQWLLCEAQLGDVTYLAPDGSRLNNPALIDWSDFKKGE